MTERERQLAETLKRCGFECAWHGPASQRWITVTQYSPTVRLQATIHDGRVAAVTCAGRSTLERLERFLRCIREALADSDEE